MIKYEPNGSGVSSDSERAPLKLAAAVGKAATRFSRR